MAANRLRALLLATAAVALLSGCESLRRATDSIGKWTAEPITVPYPEEVDLLVLLTSGTTRSQTSEQGSQDDRTYGRKVEDAIAAADLLDDEDYAAKRRIVLEALVRKSNSLCEIYKLDLLRKQARGNFLFGAASLLLGTTGAVVTHAATARALSGGAALSTGTRSELNQNYYFERTAAVLSKAIDKQREVQWRLIQANLDAPKKRYSLRGAIADVEEYHATCSLTGALSQLEKVVDNVNVLQAVEAAASAASAYGRIRESIASQPKQTPPAKE
jgi:hypothetical protein